MFLGLTRFYFRQETGDLLDGNIRFFRQMFSWSNLEYITLGWFFQTTVDSHKQTASLETYNDVFIIIIMVTNVLAETKKFSGTLFTKTSCEEPSDVSRSISAGCDRETVYLKPDKYYSITLHVHLLWPPGGDIALTVCSKSKWKSGKRRGGVQT